MAKTYTIDGRTINGEAQVKDWVLKGINKEAIEFAERFGADLAKMKDGRKDESLTTAQIRNVFGEVRRIQMSNKKKYDESSILLLRPKLAYSARRADRQAVEELADVLSEGLKAVVAEVKDGGEKEKEKEKNKRFENFANFFEAVLAYHKAAGGKE